LKWLSLKQVDDLRAQEGMLAVARDEIMAPTVAALNHQTR